MSSSLVIVSILVANKSERVICFPIHLQYRVRTIVATALVNCRATGNFIDLLHFLFPHSSISPLVTPSVSLNPLPNIPINLFLTLLNTKHPPDTPFSLSLIYSLLPLMSSLLFSALFLSPSQSHQSLDLPWILPRSSQISLVTSTPSSPPPCFPITMLLLISLLLYI